MTARRRDFQRAFGGFLALHLFEVRSRNCRCNVPRLGFGELLRSLEVIEEAGKIRRSDDWNAAGPTSLRPLGARTDQPGFLAAGKHGREQHAGRRNDSRIQRQFADRNELGQLFGIGHAHRRQQGKRDGQVVVAAFDCCTPYTYSALTLLSFLDLR